MSNPSAKHLRPLSPHLSVYKPQITSVMSILHRLTGIFLALGSLVFAVWIFGAAYDESIYLAMQEGFESVLGTLALIAWSAAFYYHLCNGIRHMFWDIGRGFALPTVTRTGVLVLLATVVLTFATWMAVWGGEMP
jgi:succinate dehydrogenase / fumarate reductase, cytochrome b subunit